MKYIVIDQTTTDAFTKEFDDKEKAIKTAEIDFSYLTKSDLKKRVAFYVLESDNPDESAENHFDGTPILELM